MQSAGPKHRPVPITSVVAFVGGLVLAWALGWRARDLIWGLWLSSLVLGYLTIVLLITSGSAFEDESAKSKAVPKQYKIAGGLFLLAFYTVHFGLFHFVHSVFLIVLFPLDPGASDGMPRLGVYRHIFASYWPFVLVTAIAQWRDIFLPRPTPGAMMKPYANVVRMHLLIFFFAGVYFIGLENFLVYAVVYAFYFLPWREWLGMGQKPASNNTDSAATTVARAAGDERDKVTRQERAKSARL